VVSAIEQLADLLNEYTVIRHQFILNKLLLKQGAGSIDVGDLEAIDRLLE
jgi:outer membrane protein